MKYVFYTLLKANDCEARLKEIINYGKLSEIDDGMKIECKLKLPILILFMYIGMALLFGVYTIKAAALFINYVASSFSSIVNGKKDIFNSLIALPVSIVIILFGKEISKWQKEKIISKMKTTLQVYKEENK
ncbi:hypothetical protein [Clostridium sp. BSD9I1]|uniref:hypothetical protein n=1 Tax=Clostridium sp. BSD9I1 TaxID=2003589 RepID=UPI001645A751|nr:hypothetical protein [Clostridium sp. BSD9I1]